MEYVQPHCLAHCSHQDLRLGGLFGWMWDATCSHVLGFGPWAVTLQPHFVWKGMCCGVVSIVKSIDAFVVYQLLPGTLINSSPSSYAKACIIMMICVSNTTVSQSRCKPTLVILVLMCPSPLCIFLYKPQVILAPVDIALNLNPIKAMLAFVEACSSVQKSQLVQPDAVIGSRRAVPGSPAATPGIDASTNLHAMILDSYKRNAMPVPSSVSSFLPKMHLTCSHVSFKDWCNMVNILNASTAFLPTPVIHVVGHTVLFMSDVDDTESNCTWFCESVRLTAWRCLQNAYFSCFESGCTTTNCLRPVTVSYFEAFWKTFVSDWQQPTRRKFFLSFRVCGIVGKRIKSSRGDNFRRKMYFGRIMRQMQPCRKFGT